MKKYKNTDLITIITKLEIMEMNDDLLKVLKKKGVLIILSLSMLFSLQGCMQYYKVRKVNNITAQEIEQFIAQKRFIIIHQDSIARYLSNPLMTGGFLTGELVNLKEDQMKYKSTKPKGATRYKNNMKVKEKYVTNEVHLYLQKAVVQDFGTVKQVMIPLSGISYTDVYLLARGRTIFSWVYPGLLYCGVGLLTAAIFFSHLIGNMHIDIM